MRAPIEYVLCLTALLFLSSAGAADHHVVPRYTAGSFVVGSGAGALGAADLNGDGLADLVVADYDDDAVSVLLNTSAPGGALPMFAAASRFAVGSHPASVTLIDLNGDGVPDLAVANFSGNSISVLLNTTPAGATVASFAAASDFAVGDGPRSVTAADLNGDGRPDLAVATFDDTDVAVLLNTTTPGASAASFAPASIVANRGDNMVLWNPPAAFDSGQGFGAKDGGDGDDETGPDRFSFEDRPDVEPDTQITSAIVTITGLRSEAPISVSGGSYSIGCGTKFTSKSGSIRDGQSVCVRHTSSNDFNTATDTTLTVGGVSDTFTSTTLAPDSEPDPFAFVDVRNALMNTMQTSNAVTISGIRSAAPISVLGGEYSIGCTATFTTADGTIADEETVCVRHVSSAGLDTATDTMLTVGGVSDTFTSTTPMPNQASLDAGALGLLDLLLGLLAVLGFGPGLRRAK